MRDVLDGVYGTGAHPNAVFGVVISICVNWGLPVHFCCDRQGAQQIVEACLEICARAINERDLG
jgi:hypothetical protein